MENYSNDKFKSVEAETFSGGTYYGDGSNLTGISGGVGDFLPLSGGTLTGSLTGTTIYATTYYGDASNMTGLPGGGDMLSTNNLSDVASQQTALNNVTNVASATNEYVLTKDTSTGNALWKQTSASGGTSNNLSQAEVFTLAVAGTNVIIPNGSETQWSGFASIFAPKGDTDITLGSEINFFLRQGGGTCILAIYEYKSGGTHTLVCETDVVELTANGINSFPVTNIPDNVLHEGDVYFFVLLHDWNGSLTIGGPLESALNFNPRRNQSFSNLGILTQAPTTLSTAQETTNGIAWFSLDQLTI